MKDKVIKAVTLMVTATLCLVIISMVVALLVGLFTQQVENDKVFEAITPAFQMIIGGFLGFLTGLSINQEEK
jgi:undecaprenyl pyrophosphate phosphatase UppP